MNKSKRIVTVLIAILMVLTAFPVYAEKSPADMTFKELIEAYTQLKNDYDDLLEKYNALSAGQSSTNASTDSASMQSAQTDTAGSSAEANTPSTGSAPSTGSEPSAGTEAAAGNGAPDISNTQSSPNDLAAPNSQEAPNASNMTDASSGVGASSGAAVSSGVGTSASSGAQEAPSAASPSDPSNQSSIVNNPSQVMESTDSSNVPIWTPYIEGLELVGEYAYPASYTGDLIYVLIFRNNSANDISFSCKGTARDASGNIIGTSYEVTESVCSGYEVPMPLRFSNVNYYDVVGLNYSMSEAKGYQKPAQNVLQYQTSDLGDKIVITVTNNGTETVEFAKVSLFYLKDGKMVDQREEYINLAGSGFLDPGVPYTETIQNPYDKEFNSVLVYLTGRY